MSLYVGSYKREPGRKVFYSDTTPTEESHGHIFTYVIGPFRTRLAADIMRYVGQGNPHLQHTSDAERMAKRIRAQGFSTWREYAAAGRPLPNPEFDLHGEMEQGYVIDESGRGYSVGREGRYLRNFSTFDDAIYFIIADMDKNRYWPNVFSVNDHGNVSLLSIRPRKRGGPNVKVVQSWV